MHRLNEEIEGKLLRTIPLNKYCLANFAYTRFPLSCQAVVPPYTYRSTMINTLLLCWMTHIHQKLLSMMILTRPSNVNSLNPACPICMSSGCVGLCPKLAFSRFEISTTQSFFSCMKKDMQRLIARRLNAAIWLPFIIPVFALENKSKKLARLSFLFALCSEI